MVYSILGTEHLLLAAGHVSTELCVLADGDMVPDRHVCLGLFHNIMCYDCPLLKTNPKPEVN